jgi:hypothetical protein
MHRTLTREDCLQIQSIQCAKRLQRNTFIIHEGFMDEYP